MTYRQNSDVLNYWLWSAGGANPCAMCMGMDGTLHGLEESLDDHPCGKCAPLPVTKPWSDILGPLGIDASDLEETSIGAPGAYETGEEKFARMSPEKQREIIGTKTGYEAYQRGEVSLKDFIGVRPAEDGFPSSYYQRSLRELQIPTRQGHLVEPSQLIAGPHRAIQRGVMTPDELMPAWAKQSAASRNVYQILRNGLPYDMMSHEQGLLITNLEQMLREDIPVNVRAAVERQLQALGQSVERQTAGTAAREVAEDVATREAATATFSVDPLTADELHAQMARVADLIQPPEVFQAAQFDLGYDAKVQARVGQEIADRLAGNADFARLADKFMELAQPEIDDLRARGWADEAIQRWIADNVPQTLQQIAAELTEAWGRGRNTIYPALKDAVRSEFNLSGVARRSARAANREAAAIWADYQPGLRAFVRAMYENTQDWLRANNITEVPLYRGIAWTRLPAQLDAAQMDMEAHTIEIAMNAASSFTASAEDALNYATDATFSDVDARYGQVIAARVPAELILSTPQSGFGNIGEFEFVVLGGRYKVVSIGQDLTALERYLRLADVERLLETT